MENSQVIVSFSNEGKYGVKALRVAGYLSRDKVMARLEDDGSPMGPIKAILIRGTLTRAGPERKPSHCLSEISSENNMGWRSRSMNF